MARPPPRAEFRGGSERTKTVGPRIDIRTIDSIIARIATAYHAGLGLPADTAAWIRQRGEQGYTELAVEVTRLLTRHPMIAASLAEHRPDPLDPRSEERLAATIEARAEDLGGDLRRLEIMFRLFVQLYLAHTPEVPAERRTAAYPAMARRWMNYEVAVAERVAKGDQVDPHSR
jgi:hypothetical protein